MAEDINSTTLVGRLCANAQLKYSNSGSAITNLSIATNRSKKQGDEWIEEASFFNVSLFGKRGESLNQYLQKGKRIAVTGYLKQDRWKDGEGNNKDRVIIVANNIQLLDGNKQEGSTNQNGSSGNNSYSQSNNAGNNNYESKPSQENSNWEKDVPF